jgi:multidrug efflux pump subunit AcrA (membrane-fusion protein)
MFSTMIAINPAVQALLDLFATSLADVRFADVDGPSLARCAAEVEAAAQAEAVARSALDAANLALQEKQEALLQRAQRALAYARVYAESDTTLTASLEAIGLPRGTRRATVGDALVLSAASDTSPRPRGRPRKRPAAEPTLEMSMPGAE